jgi:hypothetical protein
MSFDLQKMAEDESYWDRLVEKFRARIVEEGWTGPLDASGLEKDENWDALDNFLRVNLGELATEEGFEESDGGGIPGSADYATIWNLEGKYFVTGSYLNAGPYDSYEAAADEAGL